MKKTLKSKKKIKGGNYNKTDMDKLAKKYFNVIEINEDSEYLFEYFIRQQFICSLLINYYFLKYNEKFMFLVSSYESHIKDKDILKLIENRYLKAFNNFKYKDIYKKYFKKEISNIYSNQSIWIYINDIDINELCNDIYILCDIDFLNKEDIIYNIKNYIKSINENIKSFLIDINCVLMDRISYIFKSEKCSLKYFEMLDINNFNISVISLCSFIPKKELDKKENRNGIHYYITKNIIYDILPLKNKIKNCSLIIHSYISYYLNEKQFYVNPMALMTNIFKKFSKNTNENNKPYIKITSLINNDDVNNYVEYIKDIIDCNIHIPSKYSILIDVLNFHNYWFDKLKK